MEAVAVDRAGDEIDGLASKLELVVFVLNPDYQLKIVLNNEESQVVKEAQNITRSVIFEVITNRIQYYKFILLEIQHHWRAIFYDEKLCVILSYLLLALIILED